MLVKGDASARVRPGDVRSLACSDHLKEIVYRCIGERRKRYESADEMIDALRNPPPSLHVGILRSLKGAHVAFTGILSKPRLRRRPAPPSAPARSSTARHPFEPPSSSAAVPTRCRRPGGTAA